MNVKMFSFFSLIIIMLIGCTSRKPSAVRPDIIPIPFKADMKGGFFEINRKTEIVMNSTDGLVQTVADGLKQKLSDATGNAIITGQNTGNQPRNSIFLNLDRSLMEETGKEGYNLSVNKSKIEISAAEPAGLFYGVQTL